MVLNVESAKHIYFKKKRRERKKIKEKSHCSSVPFLMPACPIGKSVAAVAL